MRGPRRTRSSRNRTSVLPVSTGWAWAVLGFVVVAVAIGAVLWTQRSGPTSDSRTPIRLSIQHEANAAVREFALSRDGSFVVYVADVDGERHLFCRALDRFEPRLIDGTKGAAKPFLSPDDQHVGFFADGELRKVPLAGGVPVSLCDAAGAPRGADWGDDGRIVFVSGAYHHLRRVPDSGGESTPLTTLDSAAGETGHVWPEVLPGGEAVLFTAGDQDIESFDQARIDLVLTATGERRTLIEGGSFPRYAATGHIVFWREGNLLAAPFDLAGRRTVGAPRRVLEGVFGSSLNGQSSFEISKNGTLVFAPGVHSPGSRLVWVDRSGTVEPIGDRADAFYELSLSPDGQKLAVNIGYANHKMWIYEFRRGSFSKLTLKADSHDPVWSPDGQRLAYALVMAGERRVQWQPVDGSAPAVPITDGSSHPSWPTSWSADRRYLLYVKEVPDTRRDLWLLDLEQGGAPREFVGTEFEEFGGRFSPDGRWVAYVSNESGQDEVYVRPVSGPPARWQISSDGGSWPLWRADGGELFYRQGEQVLAVSVKTRPGFETGPPELLFEGELVNTGSLAYGVSPDGERFVMLQRLKGEEPERGAAGRARVGCGTAGCRSLAAPEQPLVELAREA